MTSRAAVFLIKALSHLPYSVLYAFSSLLRFVLFDVFGYRKRVIRENLTRSFPDKTAHERRLIARRFQLHLTDVMVETAKAATVSRSTLSKRFRFQNLELLNNYRKNGQSVITLLGHCGNWEYAGLAYSILARHTPVLAYRPLKNKTFNNFLFSVRTRFNGRLISERQIVKELFRFQKNRELFNAALIADQTPGKGKGEEFMFLNRKTPFFIGAEQLAVKLDVPVIYARVVKEKRGFYSCKFILLEETQQKSAPNSITASYVKELENTIISQPECWLWSHRRWKHVG